MDSDDHACCAPENPERTPPQRLITRGSANASSTMVRLPGGTFTMGSDDDEGEPGDGEAPARLVTLSPFWIDTVSVSNSRFAEFVAETGYVTQAESAGTSFVFAGLLPDEAPLTRAIADAPWWREVPGADWRHPEGPTSSISDREEHPVVHVSWHDAEAYCAWAGVRLPTEAEWEYAARGGLEAKRFPWGDELVPDGVHRCNIWQGRFPLLNSGDDGYYGTAPVTAFEPNAFGLYNMSGNAWEWCADWFTPYHSPEHQRDPRGPELGTHRVIRGGSYLCHESYCNRYRVSARSSNTPSSTTGNMGFRCARDA